MFIKETLIEEKSQTALFVKIQWMTFVSSTSVAIGQNLNPTPNKSIQIIGFIGVKNAFVNNCKP